MSCALSFGVPLPEGMRKEGGRCIEEDRAGSPLLPEDVEARAVFPLGAVHADAGRRNPVPPDAAVGGLYESDCQSTLHVSAGT